MDSRNTPNINLHAYKTFYVVQHTKDTRHIDEVIRDQMRNIGLNTESGPAGSKPPGIDVIVTYEDRWTWDLTMYLLSLSIDFRDCRNDVLVATGGNTLFGMEATAQSMSYKKAINYAIAEASMQVLNDRRVHEYLESAHP